MDKGGYNIERFKWSHKKEVLQLFNTEWKYSEKYFDWKYKNTYNQGILGWVAFHNSEIVGFRGLTILGLSEFNGQRLQLVSLSDGFVHKDYRRKGLFSKLNKYLIEDLRSYWAKGGLHGFVYTMSSNVYSTPTYLKLGWKALSKRNLLVYRNFSGIILNKGSGNMYTRKLIKVLNRLLNIIWYSERHDLGKYKLQISSRVFANLMADLYKSSIDNNRFIRIKDKSYYDWRLKNPNEKYIVSYLLNKDNELVAYAIFQDKKTVHCLIDYCYNEYEEFKLLIANSMHKLDSELTYTIGFGKTKRELQDLNNLHFREPRLIHKILPSSYSVLRNNLYFIVHPVNTKPKETEWFIDKFDLSDIDNWKLDMIDDDGV